MKKVQLIILLLIFAVSGVMAQSTKKTRALKPTNFTKRVSTLVSEKTRYYYSLNSEKGSIVTVQGPGKLRVLSRGRFVSNQENNINYEIQYIVDGGELQTIKFKDVKRSKEATYFKGSLGVPGQIRDFEIVLDRGYHNVELRITANNIPVAVRYLFTPTNKKKHDWISFSPIQPSNPVDLISRELSVKYYRFSKEEPLTIAVNGPTKLRVLTRVEYNYQMKGRVHYRVQVSENGEVINTYQLSSRRSEIAVYNDNSEFIPGKACELVITVPKGRHTYEIIPLDDNKKSILGRVLLPEKDVKLVD